MKTTLQVLSFIFLVSLPLSSRAQNAYSSNDGPAVLLQMTYGGQLPAGNLAERFAPYSTVGGGIEFLSNSNWFFGVDINYHFGQEVKENVLASLQSPQGLIYGDNQEVAFVQLRMRGLQVGPTFGRLFGVSKKNERTGIRVALGVHYYQHKVRIQDDPQSFVGQLAGDYKKGYDRFTNGIAMAQFIGYQHMAKNRRANFIIGFDFLQGFTEGRRVVNFDTQTSDRGVRRFDAALGFRAGWTLPLYIERDPSKLYY